MEPIILETERLIMRPFQMGDEAGVLEFSSNKEAVQFTGDITRNSLKEAKDLIKNVWLSDYSTYGYGRFAVIYKPDNKIIGFCGFKFIPQVKMTDLGYRFLPEYWGKGIATESSIKMLEFGFSELKLSKIFGTVYPENPASSTVLKKLGFTLKELKPYPGEDEDGDMEWYYLTKEEYDANKK